MNKKDKEKIIERRTKVLLNPAISVEDLSSALLDKMDFEAFHTENTTVELFGRKTGFSKVMYELLLKVVKPECIESGDVKFYSRRTFGWSYARKKILKDYGLSDLRTFGTKYKTVGLELASRVTLKNPDKEQIQRVARFIRPIKQRFPHIHTKLGECEVTVSCSKAVIDALKEAMGEEEA